MHAYGNYDEPVGENMGKIWGKYLILFLLHLFNRLVSRIPNHNIIVQNIHASTGQLRTLEFRRGNLFAATDCHDADIVIAQTNFPSETQIKLCRFLGCMKPGCKILTYLNLLPLWKRAPLMFRQLEVNRSLNDRFATSWSMHRGTFCFGLYLGLFGLCFGVVVSLFLDFWTS